MREHPSLVNVNIGPFANVDVVADAHHLPYADASVDAIFCEAVLEHLVQPHEAVKELFRVCRSEASVYAVLDPASRRRGSRPPKLPPLPRHAASRG